MLRRNPYYIQDNIRLDLRDSKGRFSPASRAKKFYIYVDDDLVRVGEFSRVSDPVYQKEILISEALSEIYEEVLEDIVDIEIAPEEFEEPTPVPEEEPELEGEELAELLYEDLLRELAEVDPVFFQEITGELPPIKGSFSEKIKEFESWSLGQTDQPEIAFAQIFRFELDRPAKTDNPEDLINIIQSTMVPAIKQAYDERLVGLELFLFNISFTKLVKQPDGSVAEVTEYISAKRNEIAEWKYFEEDILQDIYSKIRENFNRYVANSTDGTLKTVGFRFENLFETQSGET
jgi:hypothetical protein